MADGGDVEEELVHGGGQTDKERSVMVEELDVGKEMEMSDTIYLALNRSVLGPISIHGEVKLNY